jgi:hypothetical protein
MLPVINGGYSATPASSHMGFQTMREAGVLTRRYTFLSVPVPVPVAGADCQLPVVPVLVGGCRCRLPVAGATDGCQAYTPVRLYVYTRILLMES